MYSMHVGVGIARYPTIQFDSESEGYDSINRDYHNIFIFYPPTV